MMRKPLLPTSNMTFPVPVMNQRNTQVQSTVLMLCHEIPNVADRAGRLWRWLESACQFGKVYLVSPAGPRLHLHQWRHVASLTEALAIEPSNPLVNPQHLRSGTMANWLADVDFDLIICSCPRISLAVPETCDVATLVDVTDRVSADSSKRWRLPIPWAKNVTQPNNTPTLRANWLGVDDRTDPSVAIAKALHTVEMDIAQAA